MNLQDNPVTILLVCLHTEVKTLPGKSGEQHRQNPNREALEMLKFRGRLSFSGEQLRRLNNERSTVNSLFQIMERYLRM